MGYPTIGFFRQLLDLYHLITPLELEPVLGFFCCSSDSLNSYKKSMLILSSKYQRKLLDKYTFVLILFIFSNCKQEIRPGLSVRKWLQNDSTLNAKKHLVACYIYDEYGSPSTIINYSRSGSNMIDSISFIYSNTQNQVEMFHFRPHINDEEQVQSFEKFEQLLFVKNVSNLNYSLIQKDTNSDSTYYLQWLNSVDTTSHIKDTLNLLHEYVSSINNVISVSKELGITALQTNGIENKFQYVIRFKPSIFLEYGISFDEDMYLMSYSIKNNLLVRDEFQFEKHNVRRIYTYENGLITKVEIFVLDKATSKEISFSELFEYNK